MGSIDKPELMDCHEKSECGPGPVLYVNIYCIQERMDLPMATPTVDMDVCIGCGLCSDLCPRVFELRDDKAWVANPTACDTCDCQQAVDSCPVSAISLK